MTEEPPLTEQVEARTRDWIVRELAAISQQEADYHLSRLMLSQSLADGPAYLRAIGREATVTDAEVVFLAKVRIAEYQRQEDWCRELAAVWRDLLTALITRGRKEEQP